MRAWSKQPSPTAAGRPFPYFPLKHHFEQNYHVQAEHRAVVTNNLRDYRPLHHEAIVPGGPGHFGMIFMPGGYRRTRADTGRIVAALEAQLALYPGERDLANGEAWL
jgi:hypothetical protein